MDEKQRFLICVEVLSGLNDRCNEISSSNDCEFCPFYESEKCIGEYGFSNVSALDMDIFMTFEPPYFIDEEEL